MIQGRGFLSVLESFQLLLRGEHLWTVYARTNLCKYFLGVNTLGVGYYCYLGACVIDIIIGYGSPILLNYCATTRVGHPLS